MGERHDRSTVRRQFLATAVAAVGGSIAGCLGDIDTFGEAGVPPQEMPDSMPDSYPDYDADRVIGFEEAAEDAALLLRPSGQTFEPNADVSFTLSNRGEEVFTYNPYDWVVHKYVGGEWIHVAPRLVPQPATWLDPGAEFTWSTELFVPELNSWQELYERMNAADSDDESTQHLSSRPLGGGYYAFGVDGWFGSDDSTETAAAARFEFDAEQISLDVSDAIETVEQDGETVVATAADRFDTEDDDDESHVLEIERADEATASDDRHTFIEENLLSLPSHWDALALLYEHDVDRVELEEQQQLPGTAGDSSTFRFRDATFRSSTRNPDE